MATGALPPYPGEPPVEYMPRQRQYLQQKQEPTYPPQTERQPTYPPQNEPQPTYPPQNEAQPTYPPQNEAQPTYPPQNEPQPTYPPQNEAQPTYPPQIEAQSTYPLQSHYHPQTGSHYPPQQTQNYTRQHPQQWQQNYAPPVVANYGTYQQVGQPINQHPAPTAHVAGPQSAGPIVTLIQKKPANYMILSLLTLLCCCWIFGIVAIIYSMQVDSAYASGDIVAAQSASRSARTWNIVGIIFGSVIAVISFILIVAVSAASANSGSDYNSN